MLRIAIDLELESDGKNTGKIIQLGYTIFSTGTPNSPPRLILTDGDYVKVDKPLHPFIVNLTGITDKDLKEKGVSIHQAFYNMVEACKKVESLLSQDDKEKSFFQIVEWGSGDYSKLKEELYNSAYEDYGGEELNDKYQTIKYFTTYDKGVVSYKKHNEVKNIFGRSTLNVKAVFQMYQIAHGLKHSGGLAKSLRRLGLEFSPFKDESEDFKIKQRGAHDARADALNTARIYLEIQGRMNGYSGPFY